MCHINRLQIVYLCYSRIKLYGFSSSQQLSQHCTLLVREYDVFYQL